MKNAKAWERVRLNVCALTVGRKRVRMVSKGALEDICFHFQRSIIESNKNRHVPAESIVTTIALWSRKNREKVKQ